MNHKELIISSIFLTCMFDYVLIMTVMLTVVYLNSYSKEMFLQSEAKSRLAAQIAAKYDWRSPNRHITGDNRPKPSFLNTINQVPLTIPL